MVRLRTAETMFRIVPLTLSHGEYAVETFVILDTGSFVTLVDEALSTRLGARWHGVHGPMDGQGR